MLYRSLRNVGHYFWEVYRKFAVLDAFKCEESRCHQPREMWASQFEVPF